MKTNKKVLAAFVLSIIWTVICLAGEIFTIIIGFDTIDIVYNSVDLEGLALILLIPLFLIFVLGILILTQFAIVPSIYCLAKKEKIAFSIIFIIFNVLFNIINLVFLILMFTH